MALSILDGNQTATTLATTVSGGAHYPNHIIASSVTISSLPAISGTVTANANFSLINGNSFIASDDGGIETTLGVQLGYWDNNVGEYRIVRPSAGLPVAGTVTANLTAVPTHGVTIANTSVTVNGTFYQATQPVSLASVPTHGVTIAAGTAQIGSVTATISGTPSVTGSVSVLNFPSTQTIAGTVTANVPLNSDGYTAVQGVRIVGAGVNNVVRIEGIGTSYGPADMREGGGIIALGRTGGNPGSSNDELRAIPLKSDGMSVMISGTVTVGNSVTVSALPSGALTTRFGSVTTANTAQLTAAVTNSARKYLLAQNISAGTVTIGIGFSPTTTQGIQLSAGGGLSFDAFCPTGAVWWLSATTGANFTILEG
jgi:hypothetical protein